MAEILKIKGDWAEVLDDCRATVKKEMRGKTPSPEWVRRILIAEHEPIRRLEIKFRLPAIPYWVAMHLKTHIWSCRVNSQRNDRQNSYDRTKAPQDAPVDFVGECNSQHLIDTSRKRLCFQASPETRQQWEDLKEEIRKTEPALAGVMVPNCIYRCGCPEMKTCGWFDHVSATFPELKSTDIQERYDAYNQLFPGRRYD